MSAPSGFALRRFDACARAVVRFSRDETTRRWNKVGARAVNVISGKVFAGVSPGTFRGVAFLHEFARLCLERGRQ